MQQRGASRRPVHRKCADLRHNGTMNFSRRHFATNEGRDTERKETEGRGRKERERIEKERKREGVKEGEKRCRARARAREGRKRVVVLTSALTARRGKATAAPPHRRYNGGDRNYSGSGQAISTVTVTVKRLLVLPGPFVAVKLRLGQSTDFTHERVATRSSGPCRRIGRLTRLFSRRLITNTTAYRSLKVLKVCANV